MVELVEMPIYDGTAEIFKSTLTGEYYLRLKGANGEIIADTEGHKNEQDLRDLCKKYFRNFELITDASDS